MGWIAIHLTRWGERVPGVNHQRRELTPSATLLRARRLDRETRRRRVDSLLYEQGSRKAAMLIGAALPIVDA